MTRLCQWLVTVALLFVFVSAGPVEIQKRRGVSLPLKYGVSRVTRGSNVRRGNLKRSRSSIISDLNLQLEEVKRKYFDETAPVSDAPLRKRITSESVNLTDIGYDYSYFAQVQVGIPRKFYATLQPSSFTDAPCIASKRKPSTSKLERKRQYHANYETACLPIHPQRVGRLLAGVRILL